MFRNYIKTTMRNIRRAKVYSFINIAGLAVGLACCMLILLWVQDELSYDRFYKNADQVCRIIYGQASEGSERYVAVSPFAAAPAFTEEIPEIVTYTRLDYRSGLFTADDKKLEESNIYVVDPSFFKVFSHTFISGDPATSLSNTNSIVLVESTARKLFGSTDIVGKTINLSDEGDFLVTAVIKDVPRNSHFHFNALLSNHQARQQNQELWTSWDWSRGHSYVLLADDADPEAVSEKFATIIENNYGEEDQRYGTQSIAKLQRMTDIHLASHLLGEFETNGSKTSVIGFSIIAIFILFIACSNFMNLTTARSAGRSKEVGLRKVMGAHKMQVANQFLSESIFTVCFSFLIALLIVVLLLPAFNQLTLKELSLSFLTQPIFWIGAIGLILFTSIIAGSYPALYLSSFEPARILQKVVTVGRRGVSFRDLVVIAQFTISIILIASTLVIWQQINFMKYSELGFDKDHVLAIWLNGDDIKERAETLKNVLKSDPRIREASVSYGYPGSLYTTRSFVQEGKPESEQLDMGLFMADYDFIKTFGIKIAFGRDFSEAMRTDEGAFLINERAAEELGWNQEAVGKRIGFAPDNMNPIIGIVKDFHFESMREKIGPLAIRLSRDRIADLSLKLDSDDLRSTLAFVEKTWKEFEPHRRLRYSFADEDFNRYYRTEGRLNKIITTFAVIAILVACLGLFGLASFTAQQHKKNIGIRKVLGASETGIVLLLSKGFALRVLLANIIAWPVIYYFMTKFLQAYAYRISLGIHVFLLSGVLAILIALISVSYQSIAAARANPINSLKYE